MSARVFTLTAAGTPLLFAGFMSDDTYAIASGLRKRDRGHGIGEVLPVLRDATETSRVAGGGNRANIRVMHS